MSIDEIFNYMIAGVPDTYDTTEGSFFYDLLYPVAIQIYFLLNKINELSDNAFALTAKGEYLDRKAAEQGLERKAATKASGILRISGERGAIVPKGSLAASDNLLFETDKDVTISETGYVDVSASCTMAGSNGNVRIGEINRFPVTLPGLTSVENIAAFEGGYDEESDEDLLERYEEKVSRPNASGNANEYVQWAKEVEGVSGVLAVPLWNGPGTVKVILTQETPWEWDQPATELLVEDVKAHIATKRPVGAKVTVEGAKAVPINIGVRLETDESFNIDAMKKALRTYLSNSALKKSYVSYAKIGGIILSVSGVEDYSGLSVNGTSGNIELYPGDIPVLSEVVLL